MKLSSNKLDLSLIIFNTLLESKLNILDLLGHGGQDPLLETVEFIKATPCTDLADTEEDATHSLEVKRVVTAEDESKSSELDTESLDRLGFTGTGRSVRRSSETLAKGLSKCTEAAVRKWGPDKTVWDAEILKTVVQLGIRHLNVQSLEIVAFGGIDVTHLK